jgi:16S rRNA (uracil1498-N3)-methyltransferase
MRQIRIFVGQPLTAGATVTLPEQGGEHVARVLRLDSGHPVVLFNGDGREFDAELATLARRHVTARVIGMRDVNRESPLRMTLAQAVARGEKMDFVLQKATELGAAAIVPLITERTEVRLDEDRAERRLAHWRGVVASACEQCGRTQLPIVFEPQKLAHWAANLAADAGERLVLLPGAEVRARDLPTPLRAAVLVVGPEGGLSDTDLATLRAAGFRGLQLGPRILRTETAGPAALAALNALHGDF